MNGNKPPGGKGPPSTGKVPPPGGGRGEPPGTTPAGGLGGISDAEKRRAARIRFGVGDAVEVYYKFLSKLEGFKAPEVYKGKIINLSKGGALFEGTVPEASWLPKLGEGTVLLGLNVMTPGFKPVKALASLRWAKAAAADRYELGVQFEQLEPEHRTNLDRFLISHQIKTRRIRRDPLER